MVLTILVFSPSLVSKVELPSLAGKQQASMKCAKI